ncbi:abscisic acid receptor PYL4-like [Coffea arabica]|uniref:Abscisic acid receptor PYL4-like n=1 Tax=Coffea arabica TaxID=13443 RepID=A0A6P6V8Z7_COFAR|nr:abscisic acid receptor PYL4-like [Coffea arabica]
MVFQLPPTVSSDHNPVLQPNECSSTLFQTIAAPASVVWALVSDFENPQRYKPFVRSCRIIDGQVNQVGCLRRVDVASGLPASYSIERLEILDHDQRIFGFSIVSGDHRLSNYCSIMSLHPNGGDETVVVETYVIDAAEANTKEETCVFVDTIVKLNLRTLSRVAEDLAGKAQQQV